MAEQFYKKLNKPDAPKIEVFDLSATVKKMRKGGSSEFRKVSPFTSFEVNRASTERLPTPLFMSLFPARMPPSIPLKRLSDAAKVPCRASHPLPGTYRRFFSILPLTQSTMQRSLSPSQDQRRALPLMTFRSSRSPLFLPLKRREASSEAMQVQSEEALASLFCTKRVWQQAYSQKRMI